MTYRLVDTGILSDIANAIRRRNGQDCKYKPDELSKAVSMLDGSSNSQGTQKTYDKLERGLVQDSVLKGIANALRIHNMSKRKYKPRDMPAAIDALSFDEGEKPRALLHDSGILEFNLYDGRHTDLDADVAEIYDVSLTGYSRPEDVPWLESAEEIKEVDFRPSFAMSFISDMSHWFEGCGKLIEVRGFDHVANSLSRVDAMFAGCTWLDSIFSEYAVGQRARTGKPFSGCMKLVGQNLRMADDGDTGNVLHSGAGGMVVKKSSDARRFFNANLYAGGTLTFTPFEPTKQYNCIATGRLCKGVAYSSAEAMPYFDFRDRAKSVQFKSQMSFYSLQPMDWWFAGCDNIRGFTGLENLISPTSMKHTFEGSDVSRLELIGLDPSSLRDVTRCFSDCGSLKTIVVDSNWRLSNTCIGADVFLGCSSINGGLGTAFDPNNIDVEMMRIDTVQSSGYLSSS